MTQSCVWLYLREEYSKGINPSTMDEATGLATVAQVQTPEMKPRDATQLPDICDTANATRCVAQRIHAQLPNTKKTDTIVPTEDARARSPRLRCRKRASLRSWSRCVAATMRMPAKTHDATRWEADLTDSLDVLVEIPALSLLVDGDAAPSVTSGQVAVTVQKLAYQPGATDVWNLPAEQPAIAGALDLEAAVPLMRCAIPLPRPGEAALYRVTILKTGASLDAEGKTRAEQLLPTEEELLFLVIGASEGQSDVPEAHERLIPGVQRVVVPLDAHEK